MDERKIEKPALMNGVVIQYYVVCYTLYTYMYVCALVCIGVSNSLRVYWFFERAREKRA